MRINHDCIRDILLYIEENTTDEFAFISVESLLSDLQQKYDTDIINYHIRQIDKAGLVDSVLYGENVPQTIGDLSWEGRLFVDNIRDHKVWKKLKDISGNIASISLPVLINLAPDIAKTFLSKP